VGNASCVRRVAEIVRDAGRDSDLVVVVSAMSGVTNKLLAAATRSEAGDHGSAEAILSGIRDQHDTAVNALLGSTELRSAVLNKMQECYAEGDRLCQSTNLRRDLTLRWRDSISGLGERLSAPLVAAALMEYGVKSEAVEATEIIVTDSRHGAADPSIDATRVRCEVRLRKLLQRGIVPVVTGFLGATPEGVLTTLGRGGSDYSATILAAALDADEVVIWTDVDGLMTADPRLVGEACTIPEISYREAAELAHFGAKVLHPKTITAVTQCGIPLWIRNTFSPQLPGTRITPAGPSTDEGVKGLTSISEVGLITVGGPGIAGVPDVLGRTFATTAAVQANVLLILQSSSQNDICLVVASSVAERTVEALRGEFAQDLAHEKVEHITLDQTVAIVAVVGKNMRGARTVRRTFAALGRENVNIVAFARDSSEYNISFVVSKENVRAALEITHREFQLGTPESSTLPRKSVGVSPSAWQYESEQRTASAD
jgi:aspartokinase/homoserine dehydrogenase 1